MECTGRHQRKGDGGEYAITFSSEVQENMSLAPYVVCVLHKFILVVADQ